MEAIDERIVKFLRKHHVMTLATTGDRGVWCCNLFYVYWNGCFVFSSKSDSRHALEGADQKVGASIVLESKVIGNLQGAQIVGRMERGDEDAKTVYLKRFPYAALNLEDIWVVRIKGIKFTDNRLGFGKKLYWGEF